MKLDGHSGEKKDSETRLGKGKNGEFLAGDSPGNYTGFGHSARKKKITEEKIVFYEKALTKTYKNSDKMSVSMYGRQIDISGNSLEDFIGGQAIHEITHATDPKSQHSSNPKANIQEIEKAPLDNQQEYYDQLKKNN